VVVISGPSGVGKTTLIRDLLSEPGTRLAVSATTRPPRNEESDGQHYHFVSRERFDEMRTTGELLEWAEVHGHFYGTPRSEIHGDDELVILDIDVQGHRSVKGIGVTAIGVFIAPPSMEELERRLRGRESEHEGALRVRLEGAAQELAAQDEYDHIVVNDDVETAKKKLRELVLAQSGPAT